MSTSIQEKRGAALNSVGAAFFLTGLKLAAGIASGSLGLLAEAAHSGLDLVAALVTYFAVRFSSKPADGQHLYGHGKIENLSALFETLLLLITCAWIIREAWNRLVTHEVHIDASIWAFAVVVISIVVDISRSRMLYRIAMKHKSQALEADALHFSTDIWSAGVVLIGLLGTKIAEWIPTLSFLHQADTIAALCVAALVIFVCGRLGMRTIKELLDTAPEGMADQVKAIVESVDRVKDCHAIRVRSAGPDIFIDAHVSLEGNQTLYEAHDLIDKVEQVVQEAIPGANTTFHAEPSDAHAEPSR